MYTCLIYQDLPQPLLHAAKKGQAACVMAILSHKKGFEALRCSEDGITPMRMLIERLPGLHVPNSLEQF